MNRFRETMKSNQIAWRRKHLPNQTAGQHNKRYYAHVIPDANGGWLMNFWPGIRQSLPVYLAGPPRIQPHSGAHNLLSSWAVCANLYFPFRNDPNGHALLAAFLKQRIAQEVRKVKGIELEFALPDPLSPQKLLGESNGGTRGASQTSPDVAFIIETDTEGDGLILVESKFTEENFERCSGRNTQCSRHHQLNPAPQQCLNPQCVFPDPRQICHQVTWGREYWNILFPVTDKVRLQALRCCPAAKCGYQLFRQQALAEGIASGGSYDLVVSCVAYDDRNERLKGCLTSTGLKNIEQDWSSLFKGQARFKMFTHQDWVEWVRQHNPQGRWTDWLDYVQQRYGY